MQELVIWAGGRWRRVYEDGRVEGWRHRGRLMRCRDGVIEEISWERGLRNLVKGPELPVPLVRRSHGNKDRKPAVKTMLVRNASAQTDGETVLFAVRTKQQDKENRALVDATQEEQADKRPEAMKIDSEKVTTEARAGGEVGGRDSGRHHVDGDGRMSSDTTVTQSKELVIDEDDVTVFRRYIASHPSNVDLSRFDRDEHYRLRVFYSINPLVCVERCSELAAALQRRFATQLGLRSVVSLGRRQPDTDSDATPRAGAAAAAAAAAGPEVRQRVSGNESESEPIKRPLMSVNTNITRRAPGKALRVMARPVRVPKQSSVSGGREYCTLEDLTIVSWLIAAPERERMVNGNRLWKMLQADYHSLTGQKRSWHSLRNRYLRYILPSLGTYAVDPADSQRLRAHAALGELKSRKQRRRSPAPHLPRMLSAFAAGRPPRPRALRSTSPSPPPPPPPPRLSTLRPRTPCTQPAPAPAPHESPIVSRPKKRRLYNPA